MVQKDTSFVASTKILQISGVTFLIAKSNLQSQNPPPSPTGKNAISAALFAGVMIFVEIINFEEILK